MKIKRLDYKGKKWDQYKKRVSEGGDYLKGELDEIEELFEKDRSALVWYHSVKSNAFYSQCEAEYTIGNSDKCLEYMNKCLDEWICACELWVAGSKTNKTVEKQIKDKMETGIKGSLAIALNREEEVDKVMNSDCVFRLLLDKDFDKAREISKNHEVFQPMIIALCDHDNISFENELEKRIKQLRKYPYDYFHSIDIWSVVFVKLAKREGMEFYHNYIEIPDFLL